jgi:hypothetical protein
MKENEGRTMKSLWIGDAAEADGATNAGLSELDQPENILSSLAVSDEALESSGSSTEAVPTVALASYCFTCPKT